MHATRISLPSTRIEENGRDTKEGSVNNREVQRKSNLTKKKCGRIRRGRERERERKRRNKNKFTYIQISYTYLPLNLCVAPNGANCIPSIHFDTLTLSPDR
ncbi:unnamed protein product [Brugia timori]|uniref:Uncharacterized protein n=1 Tax=Brugia timori TaxID=42155 RepID=A0A3P7WVM6_9BILA|nr:unnamed protein product [Brugia timori]